MISIYEAVAPVVQQQKKPVPGAVVPQAQQQTQPAQVPAQQANMANQPAANAGQQQNSATQTQQPVNSAAVQQQTQLQQPGSPDWKKYLKYAGLIGGAIAGGTLLHDIYHNGGLSSWAHNRFGDLPSKFSNGSNFLGMVGFGDNETDTVDNDGAESTETAKARTQSAVRSTRSYHEPLPMEPGPRAPATVNASYRTVWPQPGNYRKQLDPYRTRQGYSSTWWPFGGNGEDAVADSNYTYASDWGRSGNDLSRGIYLRSRRGGTLNPINDYDLGRRSGLY